MRKKYSFNYMPLVFRLMLVSISLFCLLPNLTAQRAQQQKAEQKTKQKPKGQKPKIITGVGFDVSFPFLTTAGIDQFQNAKSFGLDQSEIHMSLGGRIPFLMTVKTFDRYSIGFGGYLSFHYQFARLGGDIDVNAISRASAEGVNGGQPDKLPPVRKDAYSIIGRGEISFSPVFYNEFALNKELALSFSIGPTFLLTFGDNYLTEVDGSNFVSTHYILGGADTNEVIDTSITTEILRSFASRDSLQFSLGVLLDLSFQIRFNQSIGMSIGSFARFYFIGQKALSTQYALTTEQTFLGDVGANVSFLLFY